MKIEGQKLHLNSVAEATQAIDKLGASNSKFMATRAIHLNIGLKEVQASHARSLKQVYNEVGAEAAISHDAYMGHFDGTTDMILMGTVYQHREVCRVLAGYLEFHDFVETISAIVENAPETQS